MTRQKRVEIDGAMGEGGGQVLRSALTLSILTGRPCRVRRIRASRRKSGLLRQHLTAALAAAEISGGRLVGAELGSSELELYPEEARGGEYTFSIGTAGSTMLVLQTLLLPLLLAREPSRICLEGGTHNPSAPSFDFVERVFLPALRSMGARVGARLERPGFFPAGGGRVVVEVEPCAALAPFERLDRGALLERRATVRTSPSLKSRVASRELEALRRALPWPEESFVHETIDCTGPGNVVLLEVVSEHASEIAASYGRLGVPSARVVREAVQPLRRYLSSDVPVGRHLADQLLLPAFVAGRSKYRTLAPTQHTLTNIEVIHRFTERRFRVDPEEGGGWLVQLPAVEGAVADL